MSTRRFTTTLFRYPGKGGWTFAIIPKKHAPPATRPWGRSPVRARVDGHEWQTSVWRDTKNDRSLLAVPAKVRGAKGHGDPVRVEIEFDPHDD
jgi:hypothetical protein